MGLVINGHFKMKIIHFLITAVALTCSLNLIFNRSETSYQEECKAIPLEGFEGRINEPKSKAFYVETSGRTYLSPRQACGLESLALHNPNLTIRVLMSAQNDTQGSIDYLEAIQTKYTNVIRRTLDLNAYFNGTPLEDWFLYSNWRKGPFKISHLSDALRFLSVWRYGGYYFDFDMIHLRPVTPYKNFIAFEDDIFAGSAALHAEQSHPLFAEILKEFNQTYRADLWGHNGPGCITRTLMRYCDQYDPKEFNYVTCKGLNILPYHAFYPINYKVEARQLFNVHSAYKLFKKLSNKATLAVHVWNNLTHRFPVKKSSFQLYVKLAKDHCPLTLALAPDTF